MKSQMVLVVALLSAGCFGKVADGGTDPEPETPASGGVVASTPLPDAPVARGAAGTCWQSLSDLPAPTGPSGTLASCSLEGTWSYQVKFSDPRQYVMVWSFDGQGRAVGGPAGTNVCTGAPWRASYTLGSEGFAVSRVRGEGSPSCGRGEDGTTFEASFSPDCKSFLVQRIVTDSCTGGGLFYEGKMTRIE